MTLKDINGHEYEGTSGSVECSTFYSTDTYHQYGGYRHMPTGEVYIIGYNTSWSVGGRVVWDSAGDIYENTENWVFVGRNNNEKEHACLLYHIKKVDDNMDNWERINFKLNGCPRETRNAQHWARNGHCIELTHRIEISYEEDVHLTNGVVKTEPRSMVMHYPPPWPYPKPVLEFMMTEIQTMGAGGIRDYEIASVGQLQEV